MTEKTHSDTHDAEPNADDTPDESPEGTAEDDGQSRRRMLRLLVGLGLGIPIAVELSTFLGLLSGGRGNDTVDIGDELLPDSPQPETVLDSSVYEGGERQYELVIEVENTESSTYEFVVGPLFTESGDKVAGTTALRDIPPGETRTLTARWVIGDATPGAVRVRGSWADERITRRVSLTRPAVYSGTPDGA